MKADVRKAFRRDKVHGADWKYIVLTIGDDNFVHKCGVYGCSSVHLLWVWKAALLVRLLWSFIGEDDAMWMFIYVEDFFFLLIIARLWPQATLLLYLLRISGTPISWRKLAAGMRLAWIGFHLDAKLGATGIDIGKRAGLLSLLEAINVH